MNTAAQELGRFAGEVAHQRSREPVWAKARAMIPAGQPIPDALNPPLLLTNSDRLSPSHEKEAPHGPPGQRSG